MYNNHKHMLPQPHTLNGLEKDLLPQQEDAIGFEQK